MRTELGLKQVVYGAVLTALHGWKQECILAARHYGYEDWMKYEQYAYVHNLIENIRHGLKPMIDRDNILDRMAHTCQVFRLSADEWDANVPYLVPEPEADSEGRRPY